MLYQNPCVPLKSESLPSDVPAASNAVMTSLEVHEAAIALTKEARVMKSNRKDVLA